MKTRIIATAIVVLAVFAAHAAIPEGSLAQINNRLRSGDFEAATSLIQETTPLTAEMPEDFEKYLASIGEGMRTSLDQVQLDFESILHIERIANHLDGWARAMPNGIRPYTKLVQTIADASCTAKPKSIAGKLGSQMQLALFALYIEQGASAAAEAARKEVLALSIYDGESGFAEFCLPILNVAYELAFKSPSSALALYNKEHAKLVGLGLAEIEEILWSTLTALRERNIPFGEFEETYKTLNEKFCKGVKIRKVSSGSPAAKVGLRRGDRIIAVDGKTVFYNSDDAGRTHLDAILSIRKATSRCAPTVFTVKRSDATITASISEDILGISY